MQNNPLWKEQRTFLCLAQGLSTSSHNTADRAVIKPNCKFPLLSDTNFLLCTLPWLGHHASLDAASQVPKYQGFWAWETFPTETFFNNSYLNDALGTKENYVF